MVPKVKRGDIVDVKITGIQPYGAFASLPDNSTGLIHISEISDKFVKSIDSFVKVGEFIKVKAVSYTHLKSAGFFFKKDVSSNFSRRSSTSLLKIILPKNFGSI